MPRLPNFERAQIPIEKLERYALDPEHPTGKHKAVVFRRVLGIEKRHAEVLAELIRASLPQASAEMRKVAPYGEEWTSYHIILGLNGRSTVVTVGWILRKETDRAPELTTCYIDSKDQERLQAVGEGNE